MYTRLKRALFRRKSLLKIPRNGDWSGENDALKKLMVICKWPPHQKWWLSSMPSRKTEQADKWCVHCGRAGDGGQHEVLPFCPGKTPPHFTPTKKSKSNRKRKNQREVNDLYTQEGTIASNPHLFPCYVLYTSMIAWAGLGLSQNGFTLDSYCQRPMTEKSI